MLDVGCRIELNGMLSYPILLYPILSFTAKKIKISLKETKSSQSV